MPIALFLLRPSICFPKIICYKDNDVGVMEIRGHKRVVAIILVILMLSRTFIGIYALDDTRQKSNEQMAIERLREGFESFEESIDMSELNISVDELPMIFSHTTKNSPYLFYVDRRLTYTYRGNTVVSVIPKYNMTREEACAAIDACREEVERISALASAGKNDLERLLLAHDIVCLRYSYDLSLESNNIYSIIKEGKGTCQGYTWIYMAVLRELGLECEYVASDKIAHIWLKVKLDGEWYNSDVTWDDPVGDLTISRKHVLFSDAKAERDGYVERYSQGQYGCNSEKYDGRDLLRIIDPNHITGDVDHNGIIDLYDLVILRRGDNCCPICADVDGDLVLNEGDTDAMRALILTNSSE